MKDLELELELRPRTIVEAIDEGYDRGVILYPVAHILREVSPIVRPTRVNSRILPCGNLCPEGQMMIQLGQIFKGREKATLTWISPWAAVEMLLGPNPDRFVGLRVGMRPVREGTRSEAAIMRFGQDGRGVFLGPTSGEERFGVYPTDTFIFQA